MNEHKIASVVTQSPDGGQPASLGRDEKSNSKPLKTVSGKYADVTLALVEEYGDTIDPLTPDQEKKLKRKLYLHIMLLVTFINLVLFVDKSTLSYASILGIYEETGINDTKYNNLNTIFYVGYAVGQWPGNYLLQRLPFGKFIATTIFIWSCIVFLHCAAFNYGGLIALRFFLGAVESVVVPALEITLGMFFIREEQSAMQPILWITCLGAPIPAGFIGYGLLYTHGSVLP